MARSAIFMVVSILSACDPGETDAESYAQKLPDARILINAPAPTPARAAVGEISSFAGFTAQVTADVNGLIESVLTTLDAVTDFDPTWSDGEQTALWGPWEDGDQQYVLFVSHDMNADIYSWGLNLKGVDEAEDAFVTIIAGQTQDDATEDTYAGWFAINFDAIAEKDPEASARGRFINSYTVDRDVVTASAGFEDFAEGDGIETVDALYHYEQIIGETGLMDVLFLADATGNGEEELHIVRSRWQADGTGRADAYLTGGQLGPLTHTATECWGSDILITYETNNYELIEDGDAASCPFAEPSFNETDAEAHIAR